MTVRPTLDSADKKYFHLITDAEWEAMKASGKRWKDVAAEYSPPDWCGYPNAVGPMGCWSLTGRMVTGEDYCKDCDLNRNHPDFHKALA